MNGTVVIAVTPFDKISQPDPGQRDGTGEQSARPNAGAAAVTNTGDGGIIAGEEPSSGGGQVDPGCIVVAGCGGTEPDGPGSEGGLEATASAAGH